MNHDDSKAVPAPAAAPALAGDEGTAGTAWVTLTTPDGPMQAYLARPSVPTDRAVVVLQEAFGVNGHVQDMTRRFARRGYLALAPQLFHRTGTDTVDYDDHAMAMSLIGALGPDEVTSDVHAALDHLRQVEGVDPARTAVVGFCFGGRAAFTAATATPGLGAVAVFYGPGVARGPHAVLNRTATITAPMIMHVGADDPTIPAADVRLVDAAMTGSVAEFRLHVHPDAGHAFACDARPSMYRLAAAAAAWASTHEFLERHIPRADPQTRY